MMGCSQDYPSSDAVALQDLFEQAAGARGRADFHVPELGERRRTMPPLTSGLSRCTMQANVCE